MKNFVPNIGNALTNTARRFGNRIGLTHGSRSWTWMELERGANALAAALVELGVGLGVRVAVEGHNCREFYEAMYAIVRTGGVYVPVNPRSSVAEVVQMVIHADAKVFIVRDEHFEEALKTQQALGGKLDVIVIGDAPLPEGATSRWYRHADLVKKHQDAPTVSVAVDRDDICWQNFTSGTTGAPKGGMNSFGGLYFALLNRLAEVTPGLGVDDRFLCMAWIGHGTGTMTAANTLVGCPMVIPESVSFDPGLCWDLIEQHGITSTFTVPTILMRLLRHERAATADVSRLRHIVVTGAAIAAADLDFATERLGRALVQYFGAVEAVGAGTCIRPADYDRDDPSRLSIGFPRLGCDLMIADENLNRMPAGEIGEICLRGPGVFRGFYNNQEATSAVFNDGWYLSGDLGYSDADGRIYIAGRKKEMFKSGGLQVYPIEIQNHLLTHEAVEEAHLISLPDSDLGEIGVAVVKLKPGAIADEHGLIEHLNGRLARYKLPRRVFFADDLPRSANGKVPKKLLVEMLIAQGHIKEGQDVARLPKPAAASAN
jgi:fatty-acyl-CoA synthase